MSEQSEDWLREGISMIKQELEKDKEKKLKEAYPCYNIAIEAIKRKDLDMFILFKKGDEKTKDRICFFTKTQKSIEIEITKDILDISVKFYNLFRENYRDDSGKDMGTKLLREFEKQSLPKIPQSDFCIWICCENNSLNAIWEWLYSDSFFWGDQFGIIRIPKEGITERSSGYFKIEKLVFIGDLYCECMSGDEECVCFDDNSEKIYLGATTNFINLDVVDCLHFVANIDSFLENSDYLDFCSKISKRLKCTGHLPLDCKEKLNKKEIDEKFDKMFKNATERSLLNAEISKPEENIWIISYDGKEKYLIDENTENLSIYDQDYKLNLLFLNFRIKNINEYPKYSGTLETLRNYFVPKAKVCIDTIIDLPDEPESFTKTFYEKLRKSNPNGGVAKVATLARANITDGSNYKLAHVVKGNPYIKIKGVEN